MSGAELRAEYVTWQHPAAGYSVQYALPVFREIEFLVSDGFRRIPHGGVETGGLLFGSVGPSSIRIDSFRQIECEHAYGPSFQLSESEIARLEDQIAAAARDDSPEKGTAVGWFIAHTRSGLVLTDSEGALFRRLFPGPGRLTVLVKPEKFKSTRFAFLIRDRSGVVVSDGSPISFSLPQGERASPVILSREPVANVQDITVRPVAPPSAPVAPQALEDTSRSVPAPATEPDPSGTAETLRSSPRLSAFATDRSKTSERNEEATASPSLLTWTLFGASFVFAVLAVYGFYLRLAPPIVPVSVTPNADTFIISWPAAETQGVNDAEIRINNGPAQALSEAQKMSGTFSTHAGGGDLMVDLVVHQRFRTLRGITRYVVTPAASAQ